METQNQNEIPNPMNANQSKMLFDWAQKQAASILKQAELKRAPHTLSLHWPKIKQGWMGGFVSGVPAGFQLGYQAANQLNEKTLRQSHAVLAGTEREAVEASNAELREFFGEMVGEASTCWHGMEAGEFDADRAGKIVDKLMERFATPVPQDEQAEAETGGQQRLPGV